jgi:hypothetical protein
VQVGSGLIWIPAGSTTPGRTIVTGTPPSPGVAGAKAASELALPAPELGLNPSGTGYVNFPEWLWVNPTLWHRFTTSATACNAVGCASATATATPLSVTWRTGDGAVVLCPGPGTPYQPSLPASAQTTDCSHTYQRSSLGQPVPPGEPDDPNNAAYPVSATITWGVSWSAPGGAGGVLPDVQTTATGWLRVAQIEILRVPSP